MKGVINLKLWKTGGTHNGQDIWGVRLSGNSLHNDDLVVIGETSPQEAVLTVLGHNYPLPLEGKDLKG